MTLQSQRPPMKVDPSGDVTVVHFTGSKVSLDEEPLTHIHDELFALADESSESDLVLDFGNVEFLMSTTLATLLSLHKKLLSKGRHLTVANLNPQVHEVFTVTMLDKILDLRLADQEVKPVSQDGLFGSPPGVLVVDDETAVLCILAARLRLAGYQVWVASHGQQAIDLYQRYRGEIAVVLLDVLMPDLDGPHTLIALRKLCSTVRCCFMTGDPGGYTEKSLFLLGAERVFYKPFGFADVLDTLKELVGQTSPCRQDRWIETLWKGA
jgi:anti-sigma B factor antagonist